MSSSHILFSTNKSLIPTVSLFSLLKSYNLWKVVNFCFNFLSSQTIWKSTYHDMGNFSFPFFWSSHYLFRSDRKYLIMYEGNFWWQSASRSLIVVRRANVMTRMLPAFVKRLKYHARASFSYFSKCYSSFLCATDLPDPVTNCSAYNATAYTMQFTCVPGNDGGIKQSFFVEVINSQAQGIFPFAMFF